MSCGGLLPPPSRRAIYKIGTFYSNVDETLE